MIPAIEVAATFIFGPIILGALVLAFAYPMVHMMIETRHRPAAQIGWTWVTGFGASVFIYAVSGYSVF